MVRPDCTRSTRRPLLVIPAKPDARTAAELNDAQRTFPCAGPRPARHRSPLVATKRPSSETATAVAADRTSTGAGASAVAAGTTPPRKQIERASKTFLATTNV